MKKVISASRRTDLPAFFPDWLAGVFREGKANVFGPSGLAYAVDLRPDAVHTIVLWSKDFSALIRNRHGLRDVLEIYDQLYFLFTVTGLGGTFIEKGAPPPDAALNQLPELVAIAGDRRRVSLRLDPVVYWREGSRIKTNLSFFATVAEKAARAGIEDIRTSFTQWYGKALRRARRHGFDYVDPPEDEKLEAGRRLVEIAEKYKLRLYSCSQNFLARVPGIRASACIDGRFLRERHPLEEDAPLAKDKSQRPECGCTVSVDIGSYGQSCPHSCLYCYANPKVS
jgi:hypothetical protein